MAEKIIVEYSVDTSGFVKAESAISDVTDATKGLQNQIKATFAEIDYSYAITSHKSQGSTYDNVIVDLKDIYSVGATTNASKSRSAYTGLTRAKNTAIIITSKATTNDKNVKKALAITPQTTLTKEEQDKVEELKKYCNPS